VRVWEREDLMLTRKPAQRAFRGLVGLPADELVALGTPRPALAVISEKVARAKFGVSEDKSKKTEPPSNMRTTLMLSPDDIIALFDESPQNKIGEHEVFEQVNFTVTTEGLQHRIKRLKKLIAASKEITEGLFVRVMKVRRGKDEVLDKTTREKFKREETARQARANVRLFQYRTALRNGGLTQKVWRVVVKSVYFRDVIDDVVIFQDWGEGTYVKDKERRMGGLVTHHTEILLHHVLYTEFDLSRYQEMMRLDADALSVMGAAEAEQKQAWANVQRWENAVIKAAVFHGVLRPRKNLLELLALTAWAQDALSVLEDIEADTTENALAIKTGGACYGGRIRSGGYTDSGRQRSLTSFDKPSRNSRWRDFSDNCDEGGGNYNPDDAETYDPR
jgi:hypothetical protein